ncbi:MAG: hydantoinase/oxoprolinase family protein [Alphaproteobacteria bacterium]|nr:hydantoinase/oxoprolinase family protein [Alphaproteobacteria bacterium]
MPRWMVGIDTGGTFTDLIAYEAESRTLEVAKVSSVPDDPSQAVMNALEELFKSGVRAEDVGFLVHGTTVATNAILEGKGVRTGLLITKGFRAVYEARGWVQPDPKDLQDPFFRKPPMLAPQSLTEEIDERVDNTGAVLRPIDAEDVRRAARRLAAKGVDAIAVCYLFSYENPAHEELTAGVLAAELPDKRVSLSSRILPVIREYVRLSTAAIDAYVGPIMERYLTRLADRLTTAGVRTPQVFLMQSNGGLMRITIGARFPNQTLLSGPAAGVVSGIEIARLTGRPDIVTLDMGGTSTDIAVIAGSAAEEATDGRIAGQDIGTPMLAVRTLGAGGGTIAWIGKDGLLKVGPESAGAMPGPAAYGRGGERPTVTDANLLLGALATGNVLGGRMRLDPAKAGEAVRRHVALPLGLDVVKAAAGIVRIVNNNMAIDLRLAFQSRGEDPRRFALAAFGGAGPLHAAMLARELAIPTVIVPPYPGLTSAMGLLSTNVKHVYLHSAIGKLSAFPVARMNALFAELRARALADAHEEGFAESRVTLVRHLDLRYPHQGYQLGVEAPAHDITDADKPALKRDFDATHQRIYGASAPDEDAEIVTFRVIAEIIVPRLELPVIAAGRGAAIAEKEERPLYDLATERFVTARVYDRARLGAGDRFAGPAVVEQFDSTTVVLAGQRAEVDRFGNLILTAGDAA